MEFRLFIENEEKKNLEATIKKLPKSHQNLLRGFHVKYQSGNTIKGDDGHIGFIQGNKIVVAAPWNYSREYTTLHEIGHLIFEKLVTPETKKQWNELVKKEKNKKEKDSEELFCMVYAQVYAQNKTMKFDHPNLEDFVSKIH